ncbi:MAG: 1-acyl-sn-glycerol-3-phosphate acyltransferase, partial [Candidatus Latescibacteria bacterium]|nr:1-acyl-sn-glycerol-3-phosphate acyltransferase [Candidatus Latescibacterota bacterium]
MLRTLLKQIAKLTLGSFFRHIDALGLNRIPKEGPLLLVANHPNMLVDILLIGIFTGRMVHFLAKSGLFTTRLTNWFIRSLGGTPVYRMQDAPEKVVRNQGMLKEVEEILNRGGCVAIFPDGGSHPAGSVHELKTGAARIA